jgi:chorismate dehydratase
VSYLNVRPLVYGLDARPDLVTLRFDVPSVCADLLAAGAIDLGMVPSVAYAGRARDRVVPGVCIGSDGPVASVALFTKVPVSRIGRLAVDTSSRTSVALTRILCARRFGIAPTFVPHAPELDAMLATADAALLIGDPALFVDPDVRQVEKIDLGTEWTAMTGLPFVWAFWAGRPGAAEPSVVRALQHAAADGMRHADEVADAYCADRPDRQPMARRYLREHLAYRLDPRAIEGLRRFYAEAVSLGLIDREPQVEFFQASEDRSMGGVA